MCYQVAKDAKHVIAVNDDNDYPISKNYYNADLRVNRIENTNARSHWVTYMVLGHMVRMGEWHGTDTGLGPSRYGKFLSNISFSVAKDIIADNDDYDYPISNNYYNANLRVNRTENTNAVKDVMTFSD